MGWYWAPAGGGPLLLPNHPLASSTKLIWPCALYTQTLVGGWPLAAGPNGTITRFAWLVKAPTLMLAVDGAVVPQEPLPSGGYTLRKVAAVPETAVKLSTAASAVPFDGMLSGGVPIPATGALKTSPGASVISLLAAPLLLHGFAG